MHSSVTWFKNCFSYIQKSLDSEDSKVQNLFIFLHISDELFNYSTRNIFMFPNDLPIYHVTLRSFRLLCRLGHLKLFETFATYDVSQHLIALNRENLVKSSKSFQRIETYCSRLSEMHYFFSFWEPTTVMDEWTLIFSWKVL